MQEYYRKQKTYPVPLLERLRFLGIFSSNSDEFFQSVATIRRMSKWGKKGKDLLGTDPEELLEKIQKLFFYTRRNSKNICRNSSWTGEGKYQHHQWKATDERARSICQKLFSWTCLSVLVPIMIDSSPKFPYLKDKSIYLAIVLSRLDKSKRINIRW